MSASFRHSSPVLGPWWCCWRVILHWDYPPPVASRSRSTKSRTSPAATAIGPPTITEWTPKAATGRSAGPRCRFGWKVTISFAGRSVVANRQANGISPIEFFHNSGNDADAMLLQGRAMIGLLSVALGLLVYLWSRQLFGPIGGLISLALYAFSPTMLSHGFLATADLSTALFFTAAVWTLWALVAPHFLVHACGKLLCTGRIVLVEVLRRIDYSRWGATDRRSECSIRPRWFGHWDSRAKLMDAFKAIVGLPAGHY